MLACKTVLPGTMLQSANKLAAIRIVARDGAVGHSCDLFFDDRSWQVRHVIARIGGWLHRRCVAIVPEDIDGVGVPARELRLNLAVADLARRPALVDAEPVTADQSALFWWALAYGSGAIALLPPPANRARERACRDGGADWHLLTPRAIRGFRLLAWDGRVGHVDDLLVDDKTWAVHYLVVELGHGWNPRKVLVATEWVVSVSRTAARVRAGLRRDRINEAPPFDGRLPLRRSYERLLRRHFGDPPAWMRGAVSGARDSVYRTGRDGHATIG